MNFQSLFTTNGPLGLTWFQWIALLAIIAGGVLFGVLAGKLVRAVVGRIVKRTRSTLDDTLLPRLAGPLAAALGLALVAALIPALELPATRSRFAYQVVRAGYFAIFYWTLFRLIDVAFHLLGETMLGRAGPSRSLIPLGSRIAKVAVLAIGAVAVLSGLGYPVASLVAGLGIGGLALALAAQKTVENLFGAFSIGVDQPFRVGDTVKIEDFIATVERIGLRSTRFRTLDRTMITMPNGRLADSRIESLSVRDRTRFAAIIGLVYGTTERQVRDVIAGFERVLTEHPKLFPEGVVVLLRDLGSSSINIEVAAQFQTADFAEFMRIRQETLLRFLRVVEDAGTSLAFPTQTVHVVGPTVHNAEQHTRSMTESANARP
ncbi:MAG TPA: mechanosensitive ion channel family protein [Gemmatimonadaceae bacterium]